MTNGTQAPEEIYALLAGTVNEFMVQRLFNGFAITMTQKMKTMHLLWQSTGGSVGDGIAIYNFIKNSPMEVICYNGGWVQSIAVIGFLGAKKRNASKTATFMIHRAHYASGIPASSHQLQAVANSVALQDGIIETILRAHINMPADQWEIHKNSDLFISAEQALQYGMIDEITDFAPPLGAPIFSVIQ